MEGLTTFVLDISSPAQLYGSQLAIDGASFVSLDLNFTSKKIWYAHHYHTHTYFYVHFQNVQEIRLIIC